MNYDPFRDRVSATKSKYKYGAESRDPPLVTPAISSNFNCELSKFQSQRIQKLEVRLRNIRKSFVARRGRGEDDTYRRNLSRARSTLRTIVRQTYECARAYPSNCVIQFFPPGRCTAQLIPLHRTSVEANVHFNLM